MIATEDSEDDSGYDSGPFCRHWSDPADCDRVCSCGHGCARHGEGWCSADSGTCNCGGFTEGEGDV